ncbi:uncharacterized protein LOC141810409 [Halichoeres trimaculatus]|uniref:uncharacterized protein LOC141810409 n=1 Tax=Halichoeres trimaculatus TaxID=147232 RepID=UPI003D9DE04F
MEQTRFIVFFIVMLSSAAEDIKSNLTRVQGGSVTFPDPVLKKGSFSFKSNTIAIVEKGQINIWEEIYEERLFWDKETGLFTLRGLQRNDSGIFKIESKDRQGAPTYHRLTVYEPVSAPEVTKLNVSTESCTLLCEVQKAEETTLYWYRNEEIVNQSSLALSLPLTVEDFRSSYRCVSENPAENKTVPVNIKTLCGERHDSKNPPDNTRSYMMALPIVFAAAVVIGAFLGVRWIYHKRKEIQETQGRAEVQMLSPHSLFKPKLQQKKKTDGSENRDSDVVYTDIHIPENRRRQERNQPSDEGSSLTTVYDKIQAHRITPAETDACLYSLTTNPSHV